MEGQTIKLKIFGDKGVLKGKGGKVGVAKLDQSWLEFLTGTCRLKLDDWKKVLVRTREPKPRTYKIRGNVRFVNYGWTAKLDEKVGQFIGQYKAVRCQYSIYLIREGANERRTPTPAAQVPRAVPPPSAVAGPSGSEYNLRRFTSSTVTPSAPGSSPPFRGDELFGGSGEGDSRQVEVQADCKPIVLEVHDDPFTGPYVALENVMGDADTAVLNPRSEIGELEERGRSLIHQQLERNVDRYSNGFLCRVKNELKDLKGGAGWARNERRAPLTSHLLEILFKV